MLIAHELTGVRVLIAHEDKFQMEYLSKVMIAAGAVVLDPSAPEPGHGPSPDHAPAAGVLQLGDPPPDAVVMSQSMQTADGGSLIDAAARGTVALLVVHSVFALPLPRIGLLCSLAVPYAAFQVVDALVDMLGRRHDRPAQL